MAAVERVHPLADAVEEDEVVTRTDREVVALTPLRADLLVAAAAAGLRVRLVTPDSSRLTDPMREAIDSAGGSWIAEGPDGARWDGLRGLAAGESRVADSFVRPPDAGTLQLVVAASLRHRAEPGTRIGPALEAVAGWGADPGLHGWGPHEPVEHVWDRDALTAHLAARSPDEARAVVAGPSAVGSTLARRTDRGVQEVLQLLVAAGPVGDEATERTLAAVPAALAALAEDAMPLFASVLARPGRADLTTAPFLQAPPAPVALLIGAPGLRDLGVDAADLRARFGALIVGRPRVPGIVLPLDRGDGGWAALERFVDHVGRDRVRRVLGSVADRAAGRS